MKMKRNITLAAMALSLVAGVALATTTTPDSQATTGPGHGYGMMNGQGPHHGAKGMMRGNGQGCLMNNGGGQGMGKMMMQGGGRGMHHGKAMMNPEMLEKRNQFLDATAELRKQLHDKQFAYRELSRVPSTTQEDLQTQEKELYAMRQELQSKRQEIFTAK